MRQLLRKLAIGLGVVVGTGLLFLVLFDLVIMPFLVDVEQVYAPDLGGMSMQRAAERVRSKGLRLAIRDSIFHETVGAGHIIGQTPEPRQRIKKGRRVFVDLSRGRLLYAVPEVAGASLREAQLKIRGSQLNLGEILYRSSGSIPEGAVIDQHPPPGARGPRGSVVALRVSSGSHFTPKRVPNLIGLSIEVVEDSLRKYEMLLGAVTDRLDNTAPPGQVLSQQPDAGASAPRETPVDLVVSVAAQSTPSDPPAADLPP